MDADCGDIDLKNIESRLRYPAKRKEWDDDMIGSRLADKRPAMLDRHLMTWDAGFGHHLEWHEYLTRGQGQMHILLGGNSLYSFFLQNMLRLATMGGNVHIFEGTLNEGSWCVYAGAGYSILLQ